MKNNLIPIEGLALNAVQYMDGVFHNLDESVKCRVMAGVEAGGAFEVRVRMAANKKPRFSLVFVGDRGELELHMLGGGPAK